MTVSVIPIPSLSDNYIWLIINDSEATVAIVDPGSSTDPISYIEQMNLRPLAILVTHHHWDHVNGIEKLVHRYSIPVYGPATESIPYLTTPLRDSDSFLLPELKQSFDVMDISGHTAGHIGYLTGDKLFCGDTLFSAGCGRLFEGTAAQLHASIRRISQLPDCTIIYCSHEYTLDNLRFAQAVEPDNAAIQSRREEVESLRNNNLPSLPVTLEMEKRYNPFLRTDRGNVMKAVAQHSGQKIDNSEDCFRYLRMWKDGF